MLDNVFSHTTTLTYCIGRDETVPSQLSTLPTISLEQTHSSNFHQATAATSSTIANCDSVITTIPKLHLTIKHADCLPILIYHPKPIVAAIHAGRKGTENAVLLKTLRYLKDTHGVTDQLQLWFGPAICKKCYQIDKKTDEHYDLYSKNCDQTRAVFSELQASIIESDLCTAHHNSKFFSYRAEGRGVPMNWSGISLV